MMLCIVILPLGKRTARRVPACPCGSTIEPVEIFELSNQGLSQMAAGVSRHY